MTMMMLMNADENNLLNFYHFLISTFLSEVQTEAILHTTKASCIYR